MKTASLTLTSYNMGDVTEADYDAWIAYVGERIDERTGLGVTLDASPFGRGSDDDDIVADDDDAQTIRDVLTSLWEEFCADGSAWPSAQTV